MVDAIVNTIGFPLVGKRIYRIGKNIIQWKIRSVKKIREIFYFVGKHILATIGYILSFSVIINEIWNELNVGSRRIIVRTGT